ncbi:MAG: PIN domain-containing protein [Aliihoeflea sp.]|uniref:PIN domain-containing protein n=1 Tax=Aliihoeflea sp. TaxID=2608088 RepID=UPI004034DC02
MAGTSSASGLLTRHILIDTSIYQAARMDLRSRAFEQLRVYVKDFGLVVHYDDVIKLECERRIAQRAQELAKAHKAFLKECKSWNYALAPSKVQVPETLASERVIAHAQIGFFSHLRRAFSARHQQHRISMDAILTRYRERHPPFDVHGSKEFPDALIIEGAVLWTRANGEKLYVVTADKRMRAAAEYHEDLVPLSSLDELLQILTTERDPAVQQEVETYLDAEDFYAQLERAIDDDLQIKLSEDGVSYYGSYQTGGASSVELMQVESFGPCRIVGFDKETVTCVAPLTFRFEIVGEFEWTMGDDDEDRWGSMERTYDATDYNRTQIVFNRGDGSIRSATLLDVVEFGDPS